MNSSNVHVNSARSSFSVGWTELRIDGYACTLNPKRSSLRRQDKSPGLCAGSTCGATSTPSAPVAGAVCGLRWTGDLCGPIVLRGARDLAQLVNSGSIGSAGKHKRCSSRNDGIRLYPRGCGTH
eukprot:COSAG01_NODE_38636_length_487_cov_0.662371_1_plen_123_part_10